ncbi:transglycosylase domain-containing protein [Roseateles sp.]|uniref:transglycosylase domain-containing protein n=1 Tax=Roseateles sp. TaxID=1971397 RepID=UPI003BAD7BC6
MTIDGTPAPTAPRLWRVGRFMAALVVAMASGVLVFDVLVVRPATDLIQRRLETAAPGERQPPQLLLDMLRRSHGDRIVDQVARYAASDLLDADQRMGSLRRMSMEWGLKLLLPRHLTDAEIASTLLATSYMGHQVRGYAAAAQREFNRPLERVNTEQAARLVAIAWSPSAYVVRSDMYERRVQRLLKTPAAP